MDILISTFFFFTFQSYILFPFPRVQLNTWNSFAAKLFAVCQNTVTDRQPFNPAFALQLSCIFAKARWNKGGRG